MNGFKPLTDESLMPIGKQFRGKPLIKVPAWHLDWWHDQLDKLKRKNKPMTSDERAVLDYIERNRKAIDLELEGK